MAEKSLKYTIKCLCLKHTPVSHTHAHACAHTQVTPTPLLQKSKELLAVLRQQSIQFTAGTIYMYSACHNKTTV